MTTLNKILDKAKEVCSTDLATAARLGVTRSAVSVWRKGGKISPEHLDRLISVASVDPALALDVLAEQASRSGNTWATVAKRLAAVVASVYAVAAVPYAGANEWTAVPSSQAASAHYSPAESIRAMPIMSIALAWLRKAWTRCMTPWVVPRGLPA